MFCGQSPPRVDLDLPECARPSRGELGKRDAGGDYRNLRRHNSKCLAAKNRAATRRESVWWCGAVDGAVCGAGGTRRGSAHPRPAAPSSRYLSVQTCLSVVRIVGIVFVAVAAVCWRVLWCARMKCSESLKLWDGEFGVIILVSFF